MKIEINEEDLKFLRELAREMDIKDREMEKLLKIISKFDDKKEEDKT